MATRAGLGRRLSAVLRRHGRDHPADTRHRIQARLAAVSPARTVCGHMRGPDRNTADDGYRFPSRLNGRPAGQRPRPPVAAGDGRGRAAARPTLASAGRRRGRSHPGCRPACVPGASRLCPGSTSRGCDQHPPISDMDGCCLLRGGRTRRRRSQGARKSAPRRSAGRRRRAGRHLARSHVHLGEPGSAGERACSRLRPGGSPAWASGLGPDRCGPEPGRPR